MSGFSVYTDGGARGNPGPAAIGVVVKDERGKTIHQFGRTIGETTNNVAEYLAVIAALEWLKAQPQRLAAKFYSDSSLVVHQLKGEWKIKEDHLRQLVEQVHHLEKNRMVTYTAIPREQNTAADAQVNQALDKC